jgi:hypothetical protein
MGKAGGADLFHAMTQRYGHAKGRKRGISMMTRNLFLLSLLLVGACASAPHDRVGPVPMGSELADLDRHFVKLPVSKGEVTEWLPANRPVKAGEERVTNEHGTFIARSLGDYDGWNATPEERNRFTGEILFFHHGSTSADVNVVTYRQGKLIHKEWGFLPG